MLRVYVAGPMAKGDYLINVRKAVDAAHEIREAGLLPFVPHLTTLWHFAYPRDYEDWMDYDFAWLRQCHALYRVPGESLGADREMVHAKEQGIPVFTELPELLAWSRSVEVTVVNK